MADRSISVRLSADVSQYVTAMGQATSATKATSDAARRDAEVAEKAAAKRRQAYSQIGQASMVAGAAIAAVGVAGVKSFADFDKSMSRAAAGTMATGSSLKALREAAIDAGAKTQFSATEAADAITAMGKAGVSTKDILGGGLAGSLSLAAAGELEVGRAAEIAATAMTQFGLQGNQLPHVADLLAAGAGKAQGSVQDLAGALKYVGPVANGLGVSIEQTTGVLAQFASQGIIGEQAGTSMRGMLTALTSPSKAAAKEMASLGINVYDAAGQFVGMDGVAQQLHSRLGGLDEASRNAALGVLFGNEQITAARVLYEGGGKAVTDWTDKVNDTGYAARQAALLTANLAGDIERLGGSLSSVLVQNGSAANETLRSLTQTAQHAVDTFGSLPGPVQQSAVTVGAAASAALLAGGAFLTLAPKVVAAKEAMSVLGVTSGRVSSGLGGLGKAAGIAGVALAGLEGVDFLTRMNDYSGDVDKLTTRMRNLGNEAVKTGSSAKVMGDFRLQAQKLFDPAALDKGEKFNSILEDLTGYLPVLGTSTDKATDAIGNYDQALAQLVAGGDTRQAAADFDAYSETLTGMGATTRQVADLFPAYSQALAEAASKQDAATQSQKDGTSQGNDYRDTIAGVSREVRKATFSLDAFDKGMKALTGRTFSVEEASDALTGSFADLAKAAHDNGKSVDGNSAAALANRRALRAAADQSLQLVSAYADTGVSSDKVVAKSKTLKAEFIRQAIEAGFSRKAAEKYASALDKVPDIVRVSIQTPGMDPAFAKLGALQRAILSIPDRKVSIDVALGTANKLAAQGARMMKASGGYISGEGGPTEDLIPAMLSNGEYVVRAAAVKRYGTGLLDDLNATRLKDGGPAGDRYALAAGGTVEPAGRFAFRFVSPFTSGALMTLIAAAAGARHATLLTDTLAYTPTADKLASVTKVTLLPHFDAAYACQGGGDFASRARCVTDQQSVLRADLDDLSDTLPEALRRAWAQTQDLRRADAQERSTTPDTTNSVLCLVGWSPIADRFQLWVYASTADFEPEFIREQATIVPAPYSCRRSTYEATDFKPLPEHHDALEIWDGLPAFAPPTSQAGWVEVGRAVRQDRALTDLRSKLKWLVGGDLHLTTLRQGEHTIRRVHHFNDDPDGAEFAQLVAGLSHPVSLAGPCLCGSGKLFSDCCYRP